MKVITVTGEVDPEDIGVTLVHEHIRYIESGSNMGDRVYSAKPEDDEEAEIANLKVTLENLNTVYRNEFLVKDNSTFLVFEDMVEEVLMYKKHGGTTLVDSTPDFADSSRNPEKLVRISNETGIKFVAGAGYYVGMSHPEHMKKWSQEKLKDEIVKDLTVGIGDTGIRAGIIGEIGIFDSKPTAEEIKTFGAAALAQAETDSGVMTHCRGVGRLDAHKAQIEIFEKAGSNPEKIAIGHRDSVLGHMRRDQYLAHFSEILDKGYYISFDCFGMEKDFKHGIKSYGKDADWDITAKYDPNSKIRFDWAPVFNVCKDIERVEAVMDIINMGYTNKILLGHDLFFKTHYKKYGGWGYSHILETVVPLLLAAGATQNQVDTILKKNPARLLERKV